MFAHEFFEACGQAELDVFVEDVSLFDGDFLWSAEAIDDCAAEFCDQVFWCACSGGDHDCAVVVLWEPVWVEFADVVEEVGGCADVGADLGKAFAVGGVL